jgi:tetratricopeptide (TPR) repeat protein
LYSSANPRKGKSKRKQEYMDSEPRNHEGNWRRHRKLWIAGVGIIAIFAVLFFLIQLSRPSLATLAWFRKLFPNNPGVVMDKGDQLLESGQYTKAITSFNSVIAEGGDLARAYAGRGNAYLGLRHFDDAISDYSFSLKYARSADVLAARCNVYRVLAKNELAKSDCEAAVALDPLNVDSHVAFGLLYLDMGNYAKARQEEEMALHIDPGSINAYYALSQVEMDQGQVNLTLNALSKCIELDPKNARWYWERGFIYFSQGQIDLAGKDMQAVLKYGRLDVDGERMLQAGTILRELGKSP